MPTNADEAGLRRLAARSASNKVVVKLFLRHPLPRQAVPAFPPDPINPTIGYLGSSNLTFAGLSQAGRTEHRRARSRRLRQAGQVVRGRWNDRWCIDISDELVEIIDESWAARSRSRRTTSISRWPTTCRRRHGRADRVPHPARFRRQAVRVSEAAVKIAAHHLNKRGGVLIGDVVGLGKTLMATALARIFEDDHGLETLIICPKNLVPMWEDYREQYRLRAGCCRISRVHRELPEPPPLSPGPHRREPQPPQPRGQTLPRDSGVHPRERKQVHLACRPRPTTRPTSISPTSCGCSCRGQGSRHPPGAVTARARRDGVHPPPSVSGSLAGGVREERICRRLARADAALPGAPHAQLHPGQLRRDRLRQWPQVPHV